MLPSASRVSAPALHDLGLGQIVGASVLVSKVKAEYDNALRRLIADLQDPANEAMTGDGR